MYLVRPYFGTHLLRPASPSAEFVVDPVTPREDQLLSALRTVLSRAYDLFVQDMVPISSQGHNRLSLDKPFLLAQRIRCYLASDYIQSSACDIQAVIRKLHPNARNGVDQAMVRDWHDGTI